MLLRYKGESVSFVRGKKKERTVVIIEPDTRRKYTRIHFARYVDLEFISDRYEHCQIKNLSLTGMFARGAFQQQKGKYCFVNLVQSGMSTDLSLQASARVVRKNDEGIAVEFTSMPFDSYMFLQTILLYEAQEPLAMLHELPVNYSFEVTDELPLSPGPDNSFRESWSLSFS